MASSPAIRVFNGCVPLLLAAALVLAPSAHEAAHDHLHDGQCLATAVQSACSHTHYDHADHGHDQPAPADPTDEHERHTCWFTYVLGAPVIPAVPPAIVSEADTAPITIQVPPARRVALGGFSHSFGTRGPPIVLVLDLA